jgi:hypothetical protein
MLSMATGAVASAPADGGGSAAHDQRSPAARGLVYDGLAMGASGTACETLLQLKTTHSPVCTHGPDAAPADTDVTRRRTTAELAAATGGGADGSSGSGIPCYGDGTTGNRVEVLYVHASDVPDRSADLAALIPQWVANTDKVFADSAAETGGVRHVRWVTGAGCQLSVGSVTVSPSGDDTFAATTSELQAKGYTRKDRKYLLLVDSTYYCGISGIQDDDSASTRNANNIGPSYSRVDSGCWGKMSPVEAHEIMHSLGGVQLSAPHSSGGWHCTDESDRMCYAENSTMTLTYPCTADHERLFDCGHDDYYSTAPVAGSYLASHWNAANNAFLELLDPQAWSMPASPSPSASPSVSSSPSPTASPSPAPSPTTSPVPSPTASPAPPATVTTTYSDSFMRKALSDRFGFTSGSGVISATGTFRKGYTMSASLLDGSGVVVATASGASPLQLAAPGAAGPYTLEVSGSGAFSYSLTVSRPAP